jgi:hypothetical protein
VGQLQHGIDDENATKQTQKYRDAEQSKKTAYDQAVAAATIQCIFRTCYLL